MRTAQGTHRRSWIAWGLVAALVLGAGAWYFRYVVRDQLWPRRLAAVEEGRVYRSGRLSPTQMQKLVREKGIRTIVDLGAFSQDPVAETVAQRTAQALGVDRVTFALEGDGTGNPQDYVEALRIITDAARQPVLVHCAAGTHRTSVCVMLYKARDAAGPFSPDLAADAVTFNYDEKKTPKTAAYLRELGPTILEAFRSGASLGPTTLRTGRGKDPASAPAGPPAAP